MSTPPPLSGLYPFLYAVPADLEEVLTQVRRSTVAKAEEIVALREAFLEREESSLLACAGALARSFAAGGQLFTFGNGGSSTDACALAHLFAACDPPARALPATALTLDVASLTALANDVGFEVVFARQLATWSRAGDVAVGLSTSGGSANVLQAFAEARRRGLVTVGFAGYDGGAMAHCQDVEHLFVVPSSSVHRIQEAQTTAYQVLWELTQGLLADTAR